MQVQIALAQATVGARDLNICGHVTYLSKYFEIKFCKVLQATLLENSARLSYEWHEEESF